MRKRAISSWVEVAMTAVLLCLLIRIAVQAQSDIIPSVSSACIAANSTSAHESEETFFRVFWVETFGRPYTSGCSAITLTPAPGGPNTYTLHLREGVTVVASGRVEIVNSFSSALIDDALVAADFRTRAGLQEYTFQFVASTLIVNGRTQIITALFIRTLSTEFIVGHDAQTSWVLVPISYAATIEEATESAQALAGGMNGPNATTDRWANFCGPFAPLQFSRCCTQYDACRSSAYALARQQLIDLAVVSGAALGLCVVMGIGCPVPLVGLAVWVACTAGTITASSSAMIRIIQNMDTRLGLCERGMEACIRAAGGEPPA